MADEAQLYKKGKGLSYSSMINHHILSCRKHEEKSFLDSADTGDRTLSKRGITPTLTELNHVNKIMKMINPETHKRISEILYGTTTDN